MKGASERSPGLLPRHVVAGADELEDVGDPAGALELRLVLLEHPRKLGVEHLAVIGVGGLVTLVVRRVVRTNLRQLPRIQEHPLGFSLLPKQFSLRELQNLYEAILDVKLDRRNFRKKFFSMELLEDTGELESDVPHRPGKLYKFNYEKYQKKERKKWFGIDF